MFHRKRHQGIWLQIQSENFLQLAIEKYKAHGCHTMVKTTCYLQYSPGIWLRPFNENVLLCSIEKTPSQAYGCDLKVKNVLFIYLEKDSLDNYRLITEEFNWKIGEGLLSRVSWRWFNLPCFNSTSVFLFPRLLGIVPKAPSLTNIIVTSIFRNFFISRNLHSFVQFSLSSIFNLKSAEMAKIYKLTSSLPFVS